MRDFFSLGALLGALLACGESATGKQLAVRAASDLGCQNEQIRSRSLDPRTVVAAGCGREATYVEDCETCTNGFTKMNETCNCTWILSGSVRSHAGAIPPSVPAASTGTSAVQPR
jgi:hypothetical protein